MVKESIENLNKDEKKENKKEELNLNEVFDNLEEDLRETEESHQGSVIEGYWNQVEELYYEELKKAYGAETDIELAKIGRKALDEGSPLVQHKNLSKISFNVGDKNTEKEIIMARAKESDGRSIVKSNITNYSRPGVTKLEYSYDFWNKLQTVKALKESIQEDTEAIEKLIRDNAKKLEGATSFKKYHEDILKELSEE
ncbi:MAG: hypothetical protein ABIH51_00295 [Patescibacteria group bacterium]